MAKLSQITIGGTSYLLNADRLRKDSIPTGWSTNVPVYFDPTDGKPHLITTTLPTSLIPGSVDEVQEYDSPADFPTTGAADRIYVAKDTNKTYRWSGTQYVEISASLALGETSSTAYYGDRGKVAYDHSQVTDGSNPHATTWASLDSKPDILTSIATHAGLDTLTFAAGTFATGSYNPITGNKTINIPSTYDNLSQGSTYKFYNGTLKFNGSSTDVAHYWTNVSGETYTVYVPHASGTAGQYLTSGGDGVEPVWKTLTLPTLASLMGSTAIGSTSKFIYWSGTAFVEQSIPSYSLNGSTLASGGAWWAPTSNGTNDQVLLANTSAAPTWSSLSMSWTASTRILGIYKGSATTPTWSAEIPLYVGATSSAAGVTGLVPAAASGGNLKYLRGDGTWNTPDNTTYLLSWNNTTRAVTLTPSTGTATTAVIPLNALSQAGLVSAPSSSDANKYWGTSASGAPSWIANKTIADLMGNMAIGDTSNFIYWSGTAFVNQALPTLEISDTDTGKNGISGLTVSGHRITVTRTQFLTEHQTVDTALSTTSTNPVQNNVITNALYEDEKVLAEAIKLIDDTIYEDENITSESLNKIRASVGLNENFDLTDLESATYIHDASSVQQALMILDASIKSVSSSMATSTFLKTATLSESSTATFLKSITLATDTVTQWTKPASGDTVKSVVKTVTFTPQLTGIAPVTAVDRKTSFAFKSVDGNTDTTVLKGVTTTSAAVLNASTTVAVATKSSPDYTTTGEICYAKVTVPTNDEESTLTLSAVALSLNASTTSVINSVTTPNTDKTVVSKVTTLDKSINYVDNITQGTTVSLLNDATTLATGSIDVYEMAAATSKTVATGTTTTTSGGYTLGTTSGTAYIPSGN